MPPGHLSFDIPNLSWKSRDQDKWTSGKGTVMSINSTSLYHSKDVLLHLDVLTNLKVGLLCLCVRIRMTPMAIRATADSDMMHSIDLALVDLSLIKSFANGNLSSLSAPRWLGVWMDQRSHCGVFGPVLACTGFSEVTCFPGAGTGL